MCFFEDRTGAFLTGATNVPPSNGRPYEPGSILTGGRSESAVGCLLCFMSVVSGTVCCSVPAAGGGSAGLFGAGSPDAIAVGGIFSGAGPYQFRANGGSVSAGSPYIVGERGPELFVPGRSGTIVPNDKMGSDNVSVVVNVDAKGTSVQGNDQQGNQLGRAISAAVQQELIKQKRPGGLLA